jgi:hypothetical protein
MSTSTLPNNTHNVNGTSHKVVELSWDDMIAGNFPQENPVRTAWREAVIAVAERAKATLPDAGSRIASAVKIVLTGDVELLEDGTAWVGSQANGTTEYRITNGTCECKDFPKAFEGWCKHRLAHAIHKRAKALTAEKLQALDHSPAPVSAAPARELPLSPPPLALPEAPASVNLYLNISGRKAQLTLRDSDEHLLLARLDAILQRFPLPEDAAEAPVPEVPEGWCRRHDVQMPQHSNAKGAWYSHRLDDGTWCKGK